MSCSDIIRLLGLLLFLGQCVTLAAPPKTTKTVTKTVTTPGPQTTTVTQTVTSEAQTKTVTQTEPVTQTATSEAKTVTITRTWTNNIVTTTSTTTTITTTMTETATTTETLCTEVQPCGVAIKKAKFVYFSRYVGNYMRINATNPGNLDPSHPPKKTYFSYSMPACQAVYECAGAAENQDPGYWSFELFYDTRYDSDPWTCTQYWGKNSDASWVADPAPYATKVYLYSRT